ncbi:MAG: 3'-5' exonuclease [Candidatus Aminicenantes bacterium]|nr:3'-5' exonuclease [Candidatus Aminicenantes bacterium]
MSRFVAIDFETANDSRDSACSVGLVVGREGEIEVSRTFLIRPPAPEFSFTWVHGLGWEDVRHAPTFGELWPTLRPWIESAEFVAAHNAPFDRSVLHACCAAYGVKAPRKPFVCTVQLARKQWGIYPTALPDVCRRLRIPLSHHESGSDAKACARIVLAAQAAGWNRRRPRRRRKRLRRSRRNG